ncbi:hypothetical protein AXG55_05175 [Silvanigrella aquatica]|uniref:Polyamine aminopropyltransferase n=2 Tax=Silvanigrella aquatica TaxID=1915309 RepID=A0A1L4CZG4_9BACT|nr:hypothetical protein AXG55_05175 [Silvanigrella aquatica]
MPIEKASSNIWLTEYLSEGEIYQYLISKILLQEQSDYQNICIVELENKSKALILNNVLQSSTADSHMYYEPFIHVPFIHNQNPENILILGAGDGSSAREALKWKCVKKIKIVEIDKAVITSCMAHIPEMSKGCFKNSKVKIDYLDARIFIKQDEQKYDVIIYDLNLKTLEKSNLLGRIDKEFLLDCQSLLKKNGYMCLEIGEVPYQRNELFLSKLNVFKSVFRSLKIFSSWVPSRCKNISFVLLSKDKIIETIPIYDVNLLLEKQLLDEPSFLNARTYIGLMNPAIFIQDYEK